jgi:hypothetical protein
VTSRLPAYAEDRIFLAVPEDEDVVAEEGDRVAASRMTRADEIGKATLPAHLAASGRCRYSDYALMQDVDMAVCLRFRSRGPTEQKPAGDSQQDGDKEPAHFAAFAGRHSDPCPDAR